jgi:hypothetical protein
MTLDFANLTATDTAAPAATRRSNRVEGTPLPGWIEETYQSGEWVGTDDNPVYRAGKGKAVTVRADQVASLRSAIRAAGKVVGLGTRIAMSDKDGKPLDWFSGDKKAFVIRKGEDGTEVKVPDNTNVTVTFSGKPMRQRRTADEIENAAEYETEDEDEGATEYEEA